MGAAESEHTHELFWECDDGFGFVFPFVVYRPGGIDVFGVPVDADADATEVGFVFDPDFLVNGDVSVIEQGDGEGDSVSFWAVHISNGGAVSGHGSVRGLLRSNDRVCKGVLQVYNLPRREEFAEGVAGREGFVVGKVDEGNRGCLACRKNVEKCILDVAVEWVVGFSNTGARRIRGGVAVEVCLVGGGDVEGVPGVFVDFGGGAVVVLVVEGLFFFGKSVKERWRWSESRFDSVGEFVEAMDLLVGSDDGDDVGVFWEICVGEFVVGEMEKGCGVVGWV